MMRWLFIRRALPDGRLRGFFIRWLVWSGALRRVL